MAGVGRGGKGERRACEAREDRTREDRGRGPSPARAHFDFPLFLRPATQANVTCKPHMYTLLTYFFISQRRVPTPRGVSPARSNGDDSWSEGFY